MEKHKYVFEEDEKDNIKTVFVGGQSVKIKTHLSLSDQANLIQHYIDKYFMKGYDRFGAESSFKIELIATMTDVELYDEKNKKVLVETDSRYFSDLFYQVVNSIRGFDDFVDLLEKTLEDAKRYKEFSLSSGVVLDKWLDTFKSLIEEVKNVDSETIQKLMGDFSALEKRVEESPVKSLIKESSKKKK